jgi:hypothetical protein
MIRWAFWGLKKEWRKVETLTEVAKKDITSTSELPSTRDRKVVERSVQIFA